jgi:hypothetical protein
MSAVAAFQAEGLFVDSRHRYSGSYDGEPFGPLTSVTTAIGALHKGALVPWAVKLTATSAINHIETLATNVGSFGKKPTIAMLTKLADQDRDQAASRGTDVHALCAAIIRGEAVHETEEERPYLDGFRRWLLSTMPRVVESEQMVANLSEGYAGTFDLIVEMAGKRWLIDIKTAKEGKGPYPETGLQLAAYAKAEFIGKPNDPVKYPMPRCQRFAVLSLRPDGPELVPYAVDGETYQAFLAALRVSWWLAGQSKTIIRRG